MAISGAGAAAGTEGRVAGPGLSPARSGSGKHSVTPGGEGVQGLSKGCCPSLLTVPVLGQEHQYKFQLQCLRCLLTPPGNNASPVAQAVSQGSALCLGYRNWPLLSQGLAEPG